MDYASWAKILSERQSYLWTGVLGAVVLLALRKSGYLEGLEATIITGAIVGGVFAGCLLLATGAGWLIDRKKQSRRVARERAAADAEALRFFDDMFHEHELILQYVATEIGKPRFKAGVERDLIAMMDLGLIEYDGPAKTSSSATYYKVRDVVWERMVAQGYLKLKKWEEDWPPPWDDNQRI